jgi:hypothetical protein
MEEPSTEQNFQSQSALPQKSPALRGMAHVVSFVFHPVFMPVVMAMLIYQISPAGFAGMSAKQLGLAFISIAVSTVLFPLFSILLMKPLGFISSYKMPSARERTIPLMATMIFYFWISHVFNNMAGAVPQVLKVLLLGNFWGIIVVFIVNIFTRVSMHTSAAGGMLGILFVLLITGSANMILPLFIALVVSGLIGTSRLILGAHQRGDVWLGYIIGIVVQIAAYIYVNI